MRTSLQLDIQEKTSSTQNLYHRIIEDDNHIPREHIFYNAVGGKSACMIFKVALMNNKTIVKAQAIQLKACLIYEDGQMVVNQSIFELKDIQLDTDGFFVVRCRINEVSTHHQFQRFRILIEADDSMNRMISSVYTNPIEVRSKIVKNSRERTANSETSSLIEEEPNSKKRKATHKMVPFQRPVKLSQAAVDTTTFKRDFEILSELSSNTLRQLKSMQNKMMMTESPVLLSQIDKDLSLILTSMEVLHSKLHNSKLSTIKTTLLPSSDLLTITSLPVVDNHTLATVAAASMKSMESFQPLSCLSRNNSTSSGTDSMIISLLQDTTAATVAETETTETETEMNSASYFNPVIRFVLDNDIPSEFKKQMATIDAYQGNCIAAAEDGSSTLSGSTDSTISNGTEEDDYLRHQILEHNNFDYPLLRTISMDLIQRTFSADVTVQRSFSYDCNQMFIEMFSRSTSN